MYLLLQIYSTTQVHWSTNLQMTDFVFSRKYIFNLFYYFPTCECLLDCNYFLLAKVCQKISGLPNSTIIMEDC